MEAFGTFYLDKEKDLVVDLFRKGDELRYVLRTPNHGTGNLIANLASLCDLELQTDEDGLRVIRGTLPCYIDGDNRMLYVLRLLDTKVANIYPDGRIERKASIPAIAKTLMSQTKDYRQDFRKTVVKTYILRECKFRTDLHTHMNANLDPDVLIALGIHHQIRYPLYYIRKLGLRVSPEQERLLAERRAQEVLRLRNSPLKGKFLDRRIDDGTFLNFASLILENLDNAAWNIPKIRASLAIMKDGQAVFTNLEKVYLYRYVFCKGVPADDPIRLHNTGFIPDREIVRALVAMERDRSNPAFRTNTLFQNKLLWIARSYARCGVDYAEISDTTLAKPEDAPRMLAEVHTVMPAITRETGVTLRFLAAVRRTPLTIVKDKIASDDYLRKNLQAIRAVAGDPYVAGSDIVGEEINDIRDLAPLLAALDRIAADHPTFTIRIHAGENDGLRDNVANAIRCVREGLAPGQPMPRIRIGHGLYTRNLASAKGRQLLEDLRNSGAVLEFQITSNVRLNNLSQLERHPLRQYLAAGVPCVQGTDGGAVYGTDSIDEQLALEKTLNLSHAELVAMHRAEDAVRRCGLAALTEKMRAFATESGTAGATAGVSAAESGTEPAVTMGAPDTDGATTAAADVAKHVEAFYAAKMRAQQPPEETLMDLPNTEASATILSDKIEELPYDRVPVILVGGSFNNDRHMTRRNRDVCALLDDVLAKGDPSKMFLVIGHSLSGYERYVATQNRGKFDLFAFVPARIAPEEAETLTRAGVRIRPSIEPSPMGIYKSVAFEVFKRRPSVLIALDGNSSGANMIQDAKNGKRKCHIFVLNKRGMLREKAKSLEGYATLFGVGDDLAAFVCDAVETCYPEHWLRKE
ncbi:MAG: hypothetical protein IKG21_00155 [Atopobiaceae bacterium]|nr:hypothetical protein [Atopobiaceae bacterium]